jgi:hypothetical protein
VVDEVHEEVDEEVEASETTQELLLDALSFNQCEPFGHQDRHVRQIVKQDLAGGVRLQISSKVSE